MHLLCDTVISKVRGLLNGHAGQALKCGPHPKPCFQVRFACLVTLVENDPPHTHTCTHIYCTHMYMHTHTHTHISQKLPPSFSDSTLPPRRIFMIFNKSGAQLIRLLTHTPEAPQRCDS